MKCVMVGSGAVGSYFGARLLQAGHAVTFIARGAQLTALRGHGLRLIDDDTGEDSLLPVTAASDLTTVATPINALIYASLILQDRRAQSSGVKVG